MPHMFPVLLQVMIRFDHLAMQEPMSITAMLHHLHRRLTAGMHAHGLLMCTGMVQHRRSVMELSNNSVFPVPPYQSR